MKPSTISAICAATFAATAQMAVSAPPSQTASAWNVAVEGGGRVQQQPALRKVALVVQNHAAPGSGIPVMALTDALTAQLSGRGLQVINPYNSIGVNQNRDMFGEKTPYVSAMALARQLRAHGAITASIVEFNDVLVGNPAFLHQYSMRITLNLADAQTGAAVCGETVKVTSPRYTNNQVAQNRQEYLGDLMHTAAATCAEKLLNNSNVLKWTPTPPPPPRPRLPPPPPPADPQLILSEVDGAVQKLVTAMRTNPIFRSNYDKAQKEVDRVPLVIVGGLVDLTGGKSPTADLGNLLGAASQNLRMTLVNSALFDAKDDALVTTITKRIIANGNSPLEDGELMSALKQHGSPDFYIVGDLRYFDEPRARIYRFRLALHNLHTGKIVWEGTETTEKRKVVAK